MEKFDLNSLPNKILVNISRGKKGAWIADLPEYGIFTEADSQMELDYFINDLIFSFFEVPEVLRRMIKYSPSYQDLGEDVRKPSLEEVAFLKFLTPDATPHFKCE